MPAYDDGACRDTSFTSAGRSGLRMVNGSSSETVASAYRLRGLGAVALMVCRHKARGATWPWLGSAMVHTPAYDGGACRDTSVASAGRSGGKEHRWGIIREHRGYRPTDGLGCGQDDGLSAQGQVRHSVLLGRHALAMAGSACDRGSTVISKKRGRLAPRSALMPMPRAWET